MTMQNSLFSGDRNDSWIIVTWLLPWPTKGAMKCTGLVGEFLHHFYWDSDNKGNHGDFSKIVCKHSAFRRQNGWLKHCMFFDVTLQCLVAGTASGIIRSYNVNWIEGRENIVNVQTHLSLTCLCSSYHVSFRESLDSESLFPKTIYQQALWAVTRKFYVRKIQLWIILLRMFHRYFFSCGVRTFYEGTETVTSFPLHFADPFSSTV